LPRSWAVELPQQVDHYPGPSSPTPGQHEGVVVFNRAWTPPGEDMTTPGLTPTYIQLKVSASLGDLSLARLDPSHWVTLADGSMAYARDGWLQWVSNGAYYRIISFGVGEEVALQFANGLR